MLVNFQKNENYYSACVVYIFNIILVMTQFNNKDDVAELFDIYIRKFVVFNNYYSTRAYCDCFDLINMFYEPDYIKAVISSFGNNEYDAYHYLAIIFQKWRLENKYKLRVQSFDNSMYDLNALFNAVRILSV